MRQLFWHQFKSGPLWRFSLLVPFLGASYLYDVDSTWFALLFPPATAVLGYLLFLPAADVTKALGMTRAQALEMMTYGAVPLAVLSVMPTLVARPDPIGLLGALLGFLTAAALIVTSLPNGEPSARKDGSRPRVRGTSLNLNLFWRSSLLWSAGVGLAVGLLYAVADGISNEGARQMLVSTPVLVMWLAMLLQPGVHPTTACSFGLTRKHWAGQVVAASLGCSLVFGLVAGSIFLLIDAPLTPILLTTAVTFVAVFASRALLAQTEFFAVTVPIILYFPIRVGLDPLNPTAYLDEVKPTLVVGAIVLTFAVLVLGFYMSGRIALARKSGGYFAAVSKG